MSYWAHLEDSDGNAVAVERHEEGGTYQLGGCVRAELNVTYNYYEHLRDAWTKAGAPLDGEGDGMLGSMIGGKRAADVATFLAHAVSTLGTERDPDYWRATPGNAGYALSILLRWARQHPDATFRVF